MRSAPVGRLLGCVAAVLLVAACSSGEAATQARDSSAAPSSAGPSSAGPVPSSGPAGTAGTTPPTPTTAVTSSTTTVAPSSTTSTVAPTLDPAVLDGISMTSVPPDVIVPTTAASLDARTNPINGRRGGLRPRPAQTDCTTDTTTCLTSILDTLGFDVTSGQDDDRLSRLQRATAVVQLDAGLPMTGQPDETLLRYLGMRPDAAAEARVREARRIGTSARGRPIMAVRYGEGPRTVLVVGQTHGDEEGGLRVLLRARSLPLPEAVTLWIIPTMNPDGVAADTRFLANGADPNRRAPSEPEQQAVHDFALAVRPALSVWYHQNYGWVGGSGASMAPAARYQALTGLGTLKRSGNCTNGFTWCPIDQALGSSSILVELPDVLTPAAVQAHALALMAVASDGAG